MEPGNQASRDRVRYDSQAAALAGRRVLQARYWGIQNFAGGAGAWDYGDWHHAVMGVELRTDRGPSCITWTSTFFPYGVEVLHMPMSQHIVTGADNCQSWDASGSGQWRGRAGSPVAGVQTFWERLTIGPGYVRGVRAAEPREVDVPVAVRIDFAAGPVWMVAGIPQAPSMQEVFVPGDEIMVVFTAGRMRQIGFPGSEFLTVSPR